MISDSRLPFKNKEKKIATDTWKELIKKAPQRGLHIKDRKKKTSYSANGTLPLLPLNRIWVKSWLKPIPTPVMS